MTTRLITPKQAAEFALADISTQPNIHFARDENECHFYQVCAAHKYGYSEPFSTEEMALNKGLSKLNAGKDLTEKAWNLYDYFRKLGAQI